MHGIYASERHSACSTKCLSMHRAVGCRLHGHRTVTAGNDNLSHSGTALADVPGHLQGMSGSLLFCMPVCITADILHWRWQVWRKMAWASQAGICRGYGVAAAKKAGHVRHLRLLQGNHGLSIHLVKHFMITCQYLATLS